MIENQSPLHTEPGGPPNRPVEVPVIDDPGEPIDPKPADTPPVPDPPEVVGLGYGSEEHYYHAEWWQPASWQPHAQPASRASRDAARSKRL